MVVTRRTRVNVNYGSYCCTQGYVRLLNVTSHSTRSRTVQSWCTRQGKDKLRSQYPRMAYELDQINIYLKSRDRQGYTQIVVNSYVRPWASRSRPIACGGRQRKTTSTHLYSPNLRWHVRNGNASRTCLR